MSGPVAFNQMGQAHISQPSLALVRKLLLNPGICGHQRSVAFDRGALLVAPCRLNIRVGKITKALLCDGSCCSLIPMHFNETRPRFSENAHDTFGGVAAPISTLTEDVTVCKGRRNIGSYVLGTSCSMQLHRYVYMYTYIYIYTYMYTAELHRLHRNIRGLTSSYSHIS